MRLLAMRRWQPRVPGAVTASSTGEVVVHEHFRKLLGRERHLVVVRDFEILLPHIPDCIRHRVGHVESLGDSIFPPSVAAIDGLQFGSHDIQ